MFEEWKKRLTKKDSEPEDDITFKSYDDSARETTAQTAPEGATGSHTDDSKGESVELKVIHPESYEEVSTVADSLLAGCTVVLNLEALDRASMVKMLDFLNGVTYCTDGEIKMVAKTTFIITPHSNVDISDM